MKINKVFNNKIENSELGRKILHIMIGTGALALLINNIITPLIIFIILMICIALSLLSLRFKIPGISFLLEKFEREEEKTKLPGRGLIVSIVGSLMALQLFERNIALAAIIILTFGDSTSYLIGKAFGKTKSFIDKRKNIEGHLAGFIFASFFAMFFVNPLLAIAGSLVAMLFESIIIEIQKIELDDNLIIPLTAGTTMFVIKMFFLII